MKTMKKFFALALALLMVLGLAVSASATDVKPTLNGHTYTAYQIFAGTQAEGSSALAVSDWGTGVNGTALLTALQSSTAFGETNPFTGCTGAADVAGVMKNYADKSAEAMAFAKLADAHKTGSGNTIGDTLAAGYYLVVDTTTNTSGENDARNLALLQLTKKGDFAIDVKVDVPEVTKKVDDHNSSDHTEDGEAWNDSADYMIGDPVPFKLTATMPTDLANYAKYAIVFHDTISSGLTFNEGTVQVFVGATKVSTGYTVKTTAAGFDVVINDVKALGATAPGTVSVTYTATLNEGAVIGVPGNPNEVYLEYYNDPSYTGNALPGDPDNPPPTGHTPPDKVVVFTYKLIVNKKDDSGNALAGAKFKLYKYDVTTEDYVQVGDEKTGNESGVFEFVGLDAGQYKLEESLVPPGYNKAEDIIFTLSASSELAADDPKLTQITATGADIIVEMEQEKPTGTLTTDVVNRPGVVLPETGGMGTTLFYIIGGLLAVAAVVLLVTKKRMASAE